MKVMFLSSMVKFVCAARAPSFRRSSIRAKAVIDITDKKSLLYLLVSMRYSHMSMAAIILAHHMLRMNEDGRATRERRRCASAHPRVGKENWRGSGGWYLCRAVQWAPIVDPERKGEKSRWDHSVAKRPTFTAAPRAFLSPPQQVEGAVIGQSLISLLVQALDPESIRVIC